MTLTNLKSLEVFVRLSKKINRRKRTENGIDPNLLCIFMSLKADKSKSFGFATFISHNPDTECRPYKKHNLSTHHTSNLINCKHAASAVLFSYHICQTTLSAFHHPCPLQSSWCKHWWTPGHVPQARLPFLCGTWSAQQICFRQHNILGWMKLCILYVKKTNKKTSTPETITIML